MSCLVVSQRGDLQSVVTGHVQIACGSERLAVEYLGADDDLVAADADLQVFRVIGDVHLSGRFLCQSTDLGIGNDNFFNGLCCINAGGLAVGSRHRE